MNNSEKRHLIEKIREVQGLTEPERMTLLGLLKKDKKYGLVWEEKEEDIEEKLRDELPVLIEINDDKVHPIISENPDAPNHLIIEGDNLAALTELSYTHSGKIDVIYIDPPYNTGKDDEFKYNDNYVDKEDTFRHSKWLSFLKKRLSIAKGLLKETGVLFISIDDYSFAQLKILCDEIFEYSSNPDHWNFLSCLIWNKQHSQQQGTFKRYHEYVLCYAKNATQIKNVLSEAEGIIEAGAMKKISVKNPASEFTFPAGTKFEAKDGTVLSGTFGDSEKVTVVNGVFQAENGVTKYPVTLKAGWTQKKQMDSWFSGKETLDTKGQKIIEFYFNSTGKIKCRKERAVTTPSSLLPEFGMGSEQTEYLNNVLGISGKFTNPKPVEMIKLFIEWFCPKDGLVLDFFAGSGTSLDSTMQLNFKDKGKRQCILCTNNENNICEEVTYERNKRVIEGYTKPNGEFVEGLKDNNLRYYRTEFLPRERSAKNMRKLVYASTGLLCIKNDLYVESDFAGKKLNAKYAKYFDDGQQKMLVVYEERAISFLVNIIKKMPEDTKIKVYVFSHGSYAYNDEFEEVSDKVELCALPQAIYDAYQKVLPKRKPQFLEEEILEHITPEEERNIAPSLDLEFDEEGGEE